MITPGTTGGRSRRRPVSMRRRILAATAVVVALTGVSGCAEVPPEPPVLIGVITLRRVVHEPERFSLTVPVINRGPADLEGYTLTADVVSMAGEGAESTDESGQRRSAARLVIETSVPVGARMVDEVTFDCPFPVVTAAPLRLEEVHLREFTFGGTSHHGVLRYPSTVVEEP